jgi:hypothetical protein
VNPQDDLAIIMGMGREWAGEIMGAMRALFGNVELGSAAGAANKVRRYAR